MLVLLKLGFNFYLVDINIELPLRITHYESSHIINGFIVMETNHYEWNLNYSMFKSSHNSKVQANVWHALFVHID